MADVFLSYAHDDAEEADKVISALKLEGLSVWSDHTIPPGQTWDTTIARRINEAKAVVVLWSEAASKSDWVKEEASIARSSNKYFPAILDTTTPPLGFSRIHAAQLNEWNGELDDPRWRGLVSEIRANTDSAQSLPGLARERGTEEHDEDSFPENTSLYVRLREWYSEQRPVRIIGVIVAVAAAFLFGRALGEAGVISDETGKIYSLEGQIYEKNREIESLAAKLETAHFRIEKLTAIEVAHNELNSKGRQFNEDYAAIDALRRELRVASEELLALSTMTQKEIPKHLYEEVAWREASIDILNKRLSQVRRAITDMSNRLPMGGPEEN